MKTVKTVLAATLLTISAASFANTATIDIGRDDSMKVALGDFCAKVNDEEVARFGIAEHKTITVPAGKNQKVWVGYCFGLLNTSGWGHQANANFEAGKSYKFTVTDINRTAADGGAKFGLIGFAIGALADAAEDKKIAAIRTESPDWVVEKKSKFVTVSIDE